MFAAAPDEIPYTFYPAERGLSPTDPMAFQQAKREAGAAPA